LSPDKFTNLRPCKGAGNSKILRQIGQRL